MRSICRQGIEVLPPPLSDPLCMLPRVSDALKPDWPKIIEIAECAGAKLGNGKKPGLWTRTVYLHSLHQAQEHGYRGTAREWEIFVRRRG